jgi:hypothetical protein
MVVGLLLGVTIASGIALKKTKTREQLFTWGLKFLGALVTFSLIAHASYRAWTGTPPAR